MRLSSSVLRPNSKKSSRGLRAVLTAVEPAAAAAAVVDDSDLTAEKRTLARTLDVNIVQHLISSPNSQKEGRKKKKEFHYYDPIRIIR